MKVAISQPTYLPWMGYFDLIDAVDLFIVLDTVQFEKRSWQQRNRIRMPGGLQWLTVPVKSRGHFEQLVREVEICDPQFAENHIRTIELAYRRAPYFRQYFPRLAEVLHDKSKGALIELNLDLIRCFLEALDIRTPLITASSLNQSGKRTELLANLCAAAGASHYVSPIGSAIYLLGEKDILLDRGVEILFHHYEHPVYRQVFSPFEPYASVVDLLFNEGDRALEILRSGRRAPYSVEEIAFASAV